MLTARVEAWHGAQRGALFALVRAKRRTGRALSEHIFAAHVKGDACRRRDSGPENLLYADAECRAAIAHYSVSNLYRQPRHVSCCPVVNIPSRPPVFLVVPIPSNRAQFFSQDTIYLTPCQPPINIADPMCESSPLFLPPAYAFSRTLDEHLQSFV